MGRWFVALAWAAALIQGAALNGTQSEQPRVDTPPVPPDDEAGDHGTAIRGHRNEASGD